MGALWNAATRGEGMRLGRKDGAAIVLIVLIASTVRFAFRFFSGRPLRGDKHRKTDAEFFTGGTRKLHVNDRSPSKWAYLPEWQRAAIRVSVLIVVVAGLWAWWSGSLFGSAVHTTLSLVAVGIVCAAGWVSIVNIDASVREAKHNRELVKPFKLAVAPLLGVQKHEVKAHLPRRGFRRDKAAEGEEDAA